MEFHLEQLGRHCRVCGGRLSKAKGKLVAYTCREYQEHLLASFSLDVTQDEPEVHPLHFCQSCYCSMKRSTKAVRDGACFSTSKIVYEWKEHTQDCSVRCSLQLPLNSYTHIDNTRTCTCQVCDHFLTLCKGGGQNRKLRKTEVGSYHYYPRAP